MSRMSKGFTLIELLIVLAILGIVLAGLYNVIYYILNSWNITEDEAFAIQEAKFSLEYMGNEIRNAKPLQDELIGVRVSNDQTTLFLGPDKEGQIRYKLENGLLRRSVLNEKGEFIEPEGEENQWKPIKLQNDKNNHLFVLDGKSVKINWQIDLGDSKKKELLAGFTIRNGLLKEGE